MTTTTMIRVKPQALKILRHLEKTGSITAREAMDDYNMSSATLARRINDLEEAGVSIQRVRKSHPIFGTKYTQYRIAA